MVEIGKKTYFLTRLLEFHLLAANRFNSRRKLLIFLLQLAQANFVFDRITHSQGYGANQQQAQEDCIDPRECFSTIDSTLLPQEVYREGGFTKPSERSPKSGENLGMRDIAAPRKPLIARPQLRVAPHVKRGSARRCSQAIERERRV